MAPINTTTGTNDQFHASPESGVLVLTLGLRIVKDRNLARCAEIIEEIGDAQRIDLYRERVSVRIHY
jgi:hypothetical protein